MTAPSKPARSEIAADEGDVPGYVAPETLPRPSGRLTKEDLDPLVLAAGRGDQRAITELLHVLRPVVARYCRARMGGRDLSYLSADDVAQDVSMAVLKALPDYQDRGGSFLYLVHAIAANKVADAYRAVARDRSEPVPELPERSLVGNEPESYALRLDLGSRLQEMLTRLAPLQQEILTLRIIVGLSANETAETLGISAGNVRVTQHRALTKLRAMIQGQEF
ncbi:RNA polymerase sigma factor ShbA [Amycolatopsis sp. FDAARGOS 1241]|uniref:RNA polymerase sigma factor ShbA n=1 Tax=Amycolatopsis sp. FDAARGOS 1241 TaxID=2778070 RepID=UPI0019502452|nr:RNA polymerase sigma factor ShbA [Amycolatopsis sp. FDAARGOS 1241]QRP44437.1 RNA polymerase sigma factor ShbA [Amycolatopsis sp. FDAARGOS 1241]